jgi:putative ABC transport system permease protein
MIANYLKLAWRNLARHKTLSFINIFGLALGMTFAILIGMWIWFQFSFDSFNKNQDHIAMALRNIELNGQKSTQLSMMLPLYDELKTNYPDIKRITRIDWGNYHSLRAGNNNFNKVGLYVDPDFLKMFTFPVVKGDAITPLEDPKSVVLTESQAAALFGTQDPIGQFVRLDGQYNMRITAVIKDIPKNSSISFDFLTPWAFRTLHDEQVRNSQTRWNDNFLRIAIEKKEGISWEDLNKQVKPLLHSKNTGLKVATLFFYPMSKWNLYGDFKDWIETPTQLNYIRMFGLIGLFILLIAAINFMNLSTARSERRALEVGIRKTVGSGRRRLIAQFLTESVFTAILAFALSLGIIELLLPFLKDLGFDDIHFDMHNLPLMASALGICLFTGLLAGSYPAFYLSSFRPVKVLKGAFRQGWQAVNLRKGLVVTQFVASIALVICTVIVMQQIQHARNRPIGYDPNNLVAFSGSADLTKNYDAFKQDLLNTGRIAAVTRSSSEMTWINNDLGNYNWTGKDPNADIFLKTVMADFDYEKTAGLQFVAGRPFSQQMKTDSNAIILNEAAVKLIGYKDPIGKTMDLDKKLTIIGVIKDVVMEDPYKPVAPCTILLRPASTSTILVRLKQNTDLRGTLDAMQPIFEKYNPAAAFEYRFADEQFGGKFATEKQVAKLAGIFAALAIIISCLGLFGLAMFMAQRRSKEVSIRKVLGASVTSLWLLLSREFVWLVLIAGVIATPIATWFMSDWLKNYDYRIGIQWWVPAGTALLAILIALVTVSTQAIRAAFDNPAKHLKQE